MGDEGEVIRVKYKLTRTILLLLSWLCMGLYSELTGPTLPDLTQRINGNYETFGRTQAGRSCGFLAGALLGGYLCSKIFKYVDVTISLSLIMAAIATTAAPFTRHWFTLAVCFFFDGASKGILAVAASMLILKMWGKKAIVPNTALHFVFGIGALTAPQLVRPFITHKHSVGDTHDNNNDTSHAPVKDTSNILDTNTDNTSTSNSFLSTTASPDTEAMNAIEIPYIVVSIFTLLVGLVILIVAWIDKLYITKPEASRDVKDEDHDTDVSPSSTLYTSVRAYLGHTGLGVAVSLLLVLSYLLLAFTTTGAERAFGKYIFSFSVDCPVQFTVTLATILDTMFWASFTFGRGLATLLVVFLPAALLLSACVILNLVSTLVLWLAGYTTAGALWASTILYGMTLSPLFPVAMSYLNSEVPFNSLLTTLSFVFSACGAIFYNWTAGYIFQYHGPQSWVGLLVGASSCGGACCVVLMYVMYVLKKRKLQQQQAATRHAATPQEAHPLT